MNIAIITTNKSVENSFSAIKLSKDHSISCCPLTNLTKILKKPDQHTFYYFDISSMNSALIKKTISQLAKLEHLSYGIIDPKGLIQDIAELFHQGAVDYIGKAFFKDGIKPKRILQAIEYSLIKKPIEEAEQHQEITKSDYILSGNNWNEIKSNHEYTFTMMFIELDNAKGIKKSYGENQFNKLTEAFHDYIEQTVSKIQGKIWMWMDHCGLILFPFDGKTCEAIHVGFTLMLNRLLICYEQFNFDFNFSYTIAINIGNTVYKKRGSTGDIISDSINSIFHLGQKFAEPGNFYITEDAIRFVPEGLTDFFLSAGPYENREHFRMKSISH